MTLIDLLNHIPAPIPVGVGFVHRIKDEAETTVANQVCRICGADKPIEEFAYRAARECHSTACISCVKQDKRAKDKIYRDRKRERMATDASH